MGSSSNAASATAFLGDESARTTGSRARLDNIDLVRGLVMVIMALDHSRGYFSNFHHSPVDLEHTSYGLFLTRWITHFCAPTFTFLAGTGAFLYGARGRSSGHLSWFLFSRGVWLLVLEFTWVRFSWSFQVELLHYGGGTLWAIGMSMVLMAGLVFLPTAMVAVIGVGLIAFHNLLDHVSGAQVGLPQGLWALLHESGSWEIPLGADLGSVHLGTGYCLLPWLGVMAAGYGFGALFLLDQQVRRKQLIGMGLALTALFIVLRYGNAYGDLMRVDPERSHEQRGMVTGPWAKQSDPVFTVFSFLNCQKYPPSLLYVLMTLGPAIFLLGLFDRPVGGVGRFFVTFGRVPLFFYLLHIPLIHFLFRLSACLRTGDGSYLRQWSPLSEGFGYKLPEVPKPSMGYELWVVYLVWVGVVLFLYPLCRWFAGVKKRHPGGILQYL